MKITKKIKCFFGYHDDDVLIEFNTGLTKVRCLRCGKFFLRNYLENTRHRWNIVHEQVLRIMFPDKFLF